MKKSFFQKVFTLGLIASILFSCQSNNKPYNKPSTRNLQAIEYALSEFSNTLANEEIRFDNIDSILIHFIEHNDVIFGSAFGFIPTKKPDGSDSLCARYAYRKNGKIVSIGLPANYDYPNDDWYAVPMKKSRAYWTKPYYDSGAAKIWMMSCAIPIYNNIEKKIIGVVTADLSLEK